MEEFSAVSYCAHHVRESRQFPRHGYNTGDRLLHFVPFLASAGLIWSQISGKGLLRYRAQSHDYNALPGIDHLDLLTPMVLGFLSGSVHVNSLSL